jgi:hypothetical protein
MWKNRDEYDRSIIDHADYFTACVFIGPSPNRSPYARVEAPDLEGARKAGIELAQEINNRRGAMIYAVKGIRSCHVENVRP